MHPHYRNEEAVRVWAPLMCYGKGLQEDHVLKEDSSAKAVGKGSEEANGGRGLTERVVFMVFSQGSKDWNRAVILEMARKEAIKPHVSCILFE